MKEVGQKVKKYREITGVKIRELANAIQCDESLLSKFEAGLRNLSIGKLFKIAEYLKIPKEFLFTDKEYSYNVFARSQKKEKNETQELIKELNYKICYHLSVLSKLAEINLEYNGPRDKYGKEPNECLVNEIKLSLCLPEKFDFNILRQQLEEKWKVIVFELPFNVSNFSAVSIMHENIVSVFVNNNHSDERKMFSLAHEIGHIVLHQNKTDQVDTLSRNNPLEKQANTFAELFLIPNDIFMDKILKLNTHFTREIIQSIADDFKVSYDCIFYKLKKENLVNYNNIEIKPINRDNPLQNEHYTYIDYPASFHMLVFIAIAKNNLSLSKAAEIFNCSIEDIEENISMLKFFIELSGRVR